MNTRRWIVVTLTFLIAGLMSCTTAPRRSINGSDLRWPTEDPQIQLDGIIEFEKTGAGARLRNWFTGGGQRHLFSRPFGIAWIDDDLIVTDPGSRRILRVSTQGRRTAINTSALDSPIGVTHCSAGIVVSDSSRGRVGLFDPTDLRLLRWLAKDLDRPTGVACIGTRIFAVETGAQRVVEISGSVVESVKGRRGDEPGTFNFPTALAADHKALWVGDTLNFRVQKIDPETGDVLKIFGQLGDASGNMPRIKGIAPDAQSNLWVSDAYLDQISMYAQDGRYLMSLGGRGTAPGTFSFPAGIAASGDGKIAIVDSLNRRIQVFSLVDQRSSE